MAIVDDINKLAAKGSNAFKGAANAVEGFFNYLGNAIGTGIESIGDAVSSRLYSEEKTCKAKLARWFGRAFRLGSAVLGALIKAPFGIIGGTAGGALKMFGALLTLKPSLFLEGLWDVFSPIFGTLIVVGGSTIALLQAVFIPYLFSEFERHPTDKESGKIQQVFKDSMNYGVIRIITGCTGLFDFNDRPFVIGNTIFMKRRKIKDGLLIHETTHVWQYQHIGIRYASDALKAQCFVSDAYCWEKEIDEQGKIDWSDFNKEAQAEFFKHIWIYGKLRDSAGTIYPETDGCFYNADGENTLGYFEINDKDYTGIAAKAVNKIRKKFL